MWKPSFRGAQIMRGLLGTTPSKNGLSEVYIGSYNVTNTSWPYWNTCDVNDFNTSNC